MRAEGSAGPGQLCTRGDVPACRGCAGRAGGTLEVATNPGRIESDVTCTEDSLELVRAAAQAADQKGGAHPVAIDVSDRLYLTDAFLIVSADNERQVRAIAESVQRAMAARHVHAQRVEGFAEGRWVLLDFGTVVVHVQRDQEREYYALDKLWGDCPMLALGQRIEA